MDQGNVELAITEVIPGDTLLKKVFYLFDYRLWWSATYAFSFCQRVSAVDAPLRTAAFGLDPHHGPLCLVTRVIKKTACGDGKLCEVHGLTPVADQAPFVEINQVG